MTTAQELQDLVIREAPPLAPEWLEWEEAQRKRPQKQYSSILERQPAYAQQCRELLSRMTAVGARDEYLAQGVLRTEFTVPSSVDCFGIPILQLDLEENSGKEPELVIIYYHGGGLFVGEVDSEELSCRRLLKGSPKVRTRVFSVGYRLMPTFPARTCVADSLDAFKAIHTTGTKTIVVGSSSGGQLAATLCQLAPAGLIDGVLLRSPVTSDPQDDLKYIPSSLRSSFTSWHPSFISSLLGYLKREKPRDGLDVLPIEATSEQLKAHPPTWIQLCTNDTLYSDGLCYGILLREADVNVKIDVVEGWPHTFWLKAPELARALEADTAMLDGLKWLLDR